MADLDDFFAKKDRKKSKTKPKFATTDEVAKKLESDIANAKKIEKTTKKEKNPEGNDPTAEVQEQDEWKEFEEEKKDYTGLKIGKLTLNSETDGNGAGQDSNEQQQITYDEAGQEVERKVAGPWKRIEQTGEQQQQKPVEEKPEIAAIPNVVGGAYVPPSKRNQAPPTIHQTRMRSKAAPDIHNEEYFPTLSGSKDARRGRNEGSFEVVSQNKSNSLRSVTQMRNSGQGQKLSLGNRFNSLSNDS